ncbi:hypothetical protein [Skermanella pratensis]|uniref:hypothetical protein n=1 Tax=Skermanella pratensis TaxID=2233999 RepID=UPI0017880257|nr:hypothetical protein [Skermanella pratensis]
MAIFKPRPDLFRAATTGAADTTLASAAVKLLHALATGRLLRLNPALAGEVSSSGHG